MDTWVTELIRQVPSAAAVLGTVWLFLRWMERNDERRDLNAKERAVADRAHQIEINNLWASTIKSLIEQQELTTLKSTEMIVGRLDNIDERYKKLGITQDLIDALKQQREAKTEISRK